MNFCFIGHVTQDRFDSSQGCGGSSLYGALLMAHLGERASIITSCSEDFPSHAYQNVQWHIQPSAKTTTFGISYASNQRILSKRSTANVLESSWISKHVPDSHAVMVCPVIDEVDPQVIDDLGSKWIGLTPQGWFRSFDENGKMTQTKSKHSFSLKKISLIVVSQEDIQNDPSAWTNAKKSARVAVCTMGKKGYILSCEGFEKAFSPLQVMEEKNPTGCGDIFATGLLFLLSKGFESKDAAMFAGYAAGLAATKNDILNSIKLAGNFLQSKL